MFSPLQKGVNHVLDIISDALRKSKHATLNKSSFELHFGRKRNTELFLGREKITKNFSHQSTI